jgi:transglutaminase-like putative cysteine protease
MSWRLAVRHVTTHEYDDDVLASYNEARVTPASTAGQLCLEPRVEIEPACRPFSYVDYWGTMVTSFEVQVPHRTLRVTASSVVETSAGGAAPAGLSWDELRSPAVTDAMVEFLAPTPAVSPGGALDDVVAWLGSMAGPRAAALAAGSWVRDRLTYAPGVTDVRSSALEALAHGRGVCQDFAHLSLAVLRATGIPARYVSGYLHPSPSGPIGEAAIGQGHAWVEWWCGGWVAWDPTHGIPAGERHVMVGRGRDYSDVAPVKGVYQGGRAISHRVSVELTRLA